MANLSKGAWILNGATGILAPGRIVGSRFQAARAIPSFTIGRSWALSHVKVEVIFMGVVRLGTKNRSEDRASRIVDSVHELRIWCRWRWEHHASQLSARCPDRLRARVSLGKR
jgi:hypothetical protein